MRRLLILFSLWMALWITPALAGLSVRVDRPTVTEGESVQLMVEYEGTGGSEPDFTPLERAFTITSRRQGTAIQIINGVRSDKQSWDLTLLPKQPGTLEIPALQVGIHRSAPLTITVKTATASLGQSARGQPGEQLFLEVLVEPETPYVQQQIVYTLRLFQAVELQEGALSEVKPTGAISRPLGDPVVYNTERHGQHYRVTEQRYALHPQASGTLTIPGPLFRGAIPERRQGFSGNTLLQQFFTTTRPVTLRGREVAVTVRPMPAGVAAGTWLPAKSLKISESWSDDPTRFRAGEPITRTITLNALGLDPSQLPELPTPSLPGLNFYPDQPQFDTQIAGNDLLGLRRQQFAVVASAPGTQTLPEVRIPWWNLVSDQPEVAILPSRTVTIAPGVGAASQNTLSTPLVAAPPVVAPTPAPATTIPPVGTATTDTPIATADGQIWLWVISVGWLATVGAWIWERRRRGLRSEPLSTRPVEVVSTVKLEGLRGNDPQAARDTLLALAAQRWPVDPPHSLLELAARLNNAQATDQLQRLDRALYSDNPATWESGELLNTLQPLLVSPAVANRPGHTALPPLYPTP